VNLAGCFLLGYLTTVYAHRPTTLLFLGTGLTGAFTTFSTFATDVVLLETRGRMHAAVYLATSLVGGLFLAWAGMVAG
jgi:CrcB protein